MKHGGEMTRNTRTLKRLEKLLKNGKMNTAEIIDEYTVRWPKEASRGTISQLLSRHKQFEEVGMERVIAEFSQYSYNVIVWQLKDGRMV